jgi:hypothetical protein
VTVAVDPGHRYEASRGNSGSPFSTGAPPG